MLNRPQRPGNPEHPKDASFPPSIGQGLTRISHHSRRARPHPPRLPPRARRHPHQEIIHQPWMNARGRPPLRSFAPFASFGGREFSLTESPRPPEPGKLPHRRPRLRQTRHQPASKSSRSTDSNRRKPQSGQAKQHREGLPVAIWSRVGHGGLVRISEFPMGERRLSVLAQRRWGVHEAAGLDCLSGVCSSQSRVHRPSKGIQVSRKPRPL